MSSMTNGTLSNVTFYEVMGNTMHGLNRTARDKKYDQWMVLPPMGKWQENYTIVSLRSVCAMKFIENKN